MNTVEGKDTSLCQCMLRVEGVVDTNEEARNKRVRIWEEVSRRRGSGAGKRGKGDDGRNHCGGPEEIRAWDGGNNGRVAVYTQEHEWGDLTKQMEVGHGEPARKAVA